MSRSTYLDRSNYSVGATTDERNALFNNCRFVFIVRDCAEHSAKWVWTVHTGHSDKGASGFKQGPEYATLKEALSVARKSFPTLPIRRQFLGRIDGHNGSRALYCPSVQLEALETMGGLYLDSQDIAASLSYVDRATIQMQFGGLDNISGIVAALDDSGCDYSEIWATDSSRPFDLCATYSRVL